MANSPAADSAVQRDRSWGLPLLAKVLIELANRLRTFQIRGLYATVLLVISFGVLVAWTPSSHLLTVSTLGVGRPVLSTLTVLQELGLYLLLPTVACSALTIEKERKTLDLLLITSLGHWTIVLEKFLSQLILAVNFIWLSLPLLGFCYALGGINPDAVLLTLLELMLTAARLAAVGIMCSAAFSRTDRALVATYGFILLACIAEQSLQYLLIPIFNSLLIAVAPGAVQMNREGVLELLMRSPGLTPLLRSNLFLSSTAGIPLVPRIMLGSMSSLSFTGLFLVLARLFIVPPVQGWLGWLFRLRLRISTRHSRRLPERGLLNDLPIAWRDMPRGKLRYWWWKYSFCMELLPVVLIFSYVAIFYDRTILRLAIGIVYYCLWLAITIRICNYAATLIVKERIHQTLDILCCTPLTNTDIVNQKMQHVWRLVAMSRLSLSACVLFHTLFFPSVTYLINSALMIWLYPQVIAWQGMASGMSARTGAGATLKASVILWAWILGPLFIPFLLGIGGMSGPGGGEILLLFASGSPLTLMVLTEAVTDMPAEYFMQSKFAVTLIMSVVLSVIGQALRLGALREWTFSSADFHMRGISEEMRIRHGRPR